MGTFNMPKAVFMPKIEPPPPPLDKDIFDIETNGKDDDTNEKNNEKKFIPQKSPEDTWIVPIHLAQDIGTWIIETLLYIDSWLTNFIEILFIIFFIIFLKNRYHPLFGWF